MTRSRRTPHPLCGSTTRTWLRTVARYGARQMRWRRLLTITALVAAGAPFRVYEALRWNRTLAGINITAPVFIIGHWQSGHSLAQALFACDPQCATLRLRHAVQPAACLTVQPILRRILQRRLPQQRIADSLPHHLDAPQGNDLALGLLTGLSIYNAWYFPESAADIFRNEVLMNGVPPARLTDWQRQYRRLLQKLLFESGRPCVAVRNAGDTARIPQLLDAFPDARFVFCHRHPYEVFAASLERCERLTHAFSLSPRTPPPDAESLTLDWYEQLLQCYLRNRRKIPAGRLIEVAYADLHQRPAAAMQRIYEALGLPGFDEARSGMQRLPQEQAWELAGARPLTERQRQAVTDRWDFAFREWGYLA
ncbi:MAG: sulfotransferase [Planctomycetaceae bacterium]